MALWRVSPTVLLSEWTARLVLVPPPDSWPFDADEAHHWMDRLVRDEDKRLAKKRGRPAPRGSAYDVARFDRSRALALAALAELELGKHVYLTTAQDWNRYRFGDGGRILDETKAGPFFALTGYLGVAAGAGMLRAKRVDDG